MVDPLVASGRLTLRAEATDEHTSNAKKRPGRASVCGALVAAFNAPATQTVET